MTLCKKVYEIMDELPSSELYGLSSQIKRASVAIPSNIAEGCSRKTSKEFARFLEISIGSAFEIETQLILCKDLGMIESKKIDVIITELTKLQRRINALRSAILKAKQ